MKTDSFLRWAEQHNAMTSDIWPIPTNVNSSQWVLIIVVHRTKLLLYLDSLHGYDEAIISLVFQFLSSRSMMAFKRLVMISKWTIPAPTDIPRQLNEWDCGVHVLQWSYIVCSGQPLPYSKELNMSEICNWMANLILKEQHFEQDNNHLGSTVIQRLKEVKRHAQALRVKRITISRDVPVNFASTLEFLSNITRSLFNTNCSVCHLGKQCTHPQRNRKMTFCEGDCQDWFHVA
ncbi:hypothetical protein BSL78_07632 [Apostichopus japonicus]|uniref:Ubiquitin-like protease family profile domain-containing protein n=1 Tax=Stichopus japonicus TaxID=307972 RepID=A0A2G8L5D9_STIJA|nr:hypothetical protein BSL78_07632 [Apostichopus japonicus]